MAIYTWLLVDTVFGFLFSPSVCSSCIICVQTSQSYQPLWLQQCTQWCYPVILVSYNQGQGSIEKYPYKTNLLLLFLTILLPCPSRPSTSWDYNWSPVTDLLALGSTACTCQSIPLKQCCCSPWHCYTLLVTRNSQARTGMILPCCSHSLPSGLKPLKCNNIFFSFPIQSLPNSFK